MYEHIGRALMWGATQWWKDEVIDVVGKLSFYFRFFRQCSCASFMLVRFILRGIKRQKSSGVLWHCWGMLIVTVLIDFSIDSLVKCPNWKKGTKTILRSRGWSFLMRTYRNKSLAISLLDRQLLILVKASKSSGFLGVYFASLYRQINNDVTWSIRNKKTEKTIIDWKLCVIISPRGFLVV